jgi:hypothetical protein
MPQMRKNLEHKKHLPVRHMPQLPKQNTKQTIPQNPTNTRSRNGKESFEKTLIQPMRQASLAVCTVPYVDTHKQPTHPNPAHFLQEP